MRALLLSLCFVSLAAGSATASTTLTGGNILDQTWTTANSPYIVEGDITIPTGSTLTIEAGVAIQMPVGDMQMSGVSTTQTEITVHGSLHIAGTAASPVQITGVTPSSWYGIEIASDAQSVELDHVIVTDAVIGVTYAATGDVLSSVGLDVESPSNRGIWVTAGSPAFDELIVSDSLVYALAVEQTGSLGVTNCIIDHAATGLVVATTGSSSVVITNCTFDTNTIAARNNSTTLSTITVTNSLVTNGDIGLLGPGVTITYSDVWNNSGGNYSSATAGTGCLSANPQYVSATDYHLQATSVAIDSGTTGPDHDLSDHVRPTDGNGIGGPQWDMGAYEYDSTVTAPGNDAGIGGDAGAGADGGLGRRDGGGRDASGDPEAGPGGGCCDSGRSSGSGSLALGLLAAIVLRRRR